MDSIHSWDWCEDELRECGGSFVSSLKGRGALIQPVDLPLHFSLSLSPLPLPKPAVQIPQGIGMDAPGFLESMACFDPRAHTTSPLLRTLKTPFPCLWPRMREVGTASLTKEVSELAQSVL